MIRLVRHFYTYEGVFGALTLDDKYLCATAELPWKANAKNASCIPEGSYTLKRHHSEKFGETFEVCGGHGRTGILFHKGNIPAKDSKGCILVGLDHGWIGSSKAVICSGHAMDALMAALDGMDEVPIEIVQSTASTKGAATCP